MELRVKEYPEGWLIEQRKRRWLFKGKWRAYLTYHGTEEPFYYETRLTAIEALLKEMKWKLLAESYE